MPDRSRKPRDLNALAAPVVADSTDADKPELADDGKDPAAVALGRREGRDECANLSWPHLVA